MTNLDCSQVDAKRYFCPSSLSRTEASNNQEICVSIDELCDGMAQCPGEEDEDKAICLFHKAVSSSIKLTSDAIYLYITISDD